MPEQKMTTEAEAEARKSHALLDNVFGLNKQELDAIEVLGFQLYEQGRNAEAQSIFRGFIALNQRRYTGYAGMGALALAERKLDEAARWLEQALERNADDPHSARQSGRNAVAAGPV